MRHFEWDFEEVRVGVPERTPRESEFFRKTSSLEALVRETIQNSLDARQPDADHVLVRFTVRGVLRDDIRYYLEGLKPHLEACGMAEDYKSPRWGYLVIEDFNTTGLTGDVGEREKKVPSVGESNFYDFWYREGKAGKTRKNAGGKWGVGKTVLHTVTRLRTFWALTLRCDDHRELLMGKSQLEPHSIGETRYNYYGYFREKDGRPIEDPDVVQDFKQRFTLTRDQEPGLSIVVPIRDAARQPILKCAIAQYFYSIAKGYLVVEVRDKQSSQLLDASNLLDVSSRISDWSGTVWKDRYGSSEEVRNLLNFVTEAVALQAGEVAYLAPRGETPSITDDSFGGNIEAIRKSFNEGQLLGFRVPLELKFRESAGRSAPTHFDVFLRKYSPENLTGADEFYIRSGIWIIKVDRQLGSRPIRSMVVAEDDAVARFLRDAEPPAHTEWEDGSEDLDRYQNGKTILRFIKGSTREIVSLLDRPSTEIFPDLLREIFSIPEARRKLGPEVVEGPKIVIPERHDSPFRIERTQEGFRVRLSMCRPSPQRAVVRVAYDCLRGNPFKRYRPWDFDLANMTTSCLGCRVIRCERNEIEVSDICDDLSIEVNGFDSNRDIVVEVSAVG